LEKLEKLNEETLERRGTRIKELIAEAKMKLAEIEESLRGIAKRRKDRKLLIEPFKSFAVKYKIIDNADDDEEVGEVHTPALMTMHRTIPTEKQKSTGVGRDWMENALSSESIVGTSLSTSSEGAALAGIKRSFQVEYLAEEDDRIDGIPKKEAKLS
jgi:hypothetical protein